MTHLAAAVKQSKSQIVDEVITEMRDTKDSIMSVLKIAKDDADDNLLQALLEAFSMIKINTLEDFDRWARTILKGGSLALDGPSRTGASN